MHEPKFINAEQFIAKYGDWYTEEGTETGFIGTIKYLVEQMPAADVAEVVRCKDCKHYQFADNRAFGMPVKICEWFGFEDVDDDDFCSRAERKEE